MTESKLESVCRHCGTPFKGLSDFCCRGCETVYQLLHEADLGAYYRIRATGVSFGAAGPVEFKPNESNADFRYMDTPAFRAAFCVGESELSVRFFVEGIHCVACIWLLEKLTTMSDSIIESRLTMGDSVLTVRFKADAELSQIAQLISKLGYTPHPIQVSSSSQGLIQKENRQMLIRIGVAGACLGNLMILAVSLYAGANGVIGDVFRWVSLGLTLPVMGYSAVPFYVSAWGHLRVRRLSIDLPVTLALWIGFIGSLVGLSRGGPIYFDSIVMFTFLLLSTRYFLKKLHQQFDYQTHFASFLFPASCMKWNDALGDFDSVLTSSLEPGDRICIPEDSIIPVDGQLRSESAIIDDQLLTGESIPKTLAVKADLFAGTRNSGKSIEADVVNVGLETRVAQLFQSAIQMTKPPLVTIADRISSYFLGGLLGLSVLLILNGIWTGSVMSAFEEVLALMMVACPCALALATPLVYSMGLQKASWMGLLVKSPDVFERCAKLKTVVLDKTGTLTTGIMTVTRWEPSTISEEDLSILYGLELYQKHPIARSIVEWISTQKPDLTPRHVESIQLMDRGILGQVNGQKVMIRQSGSDHTLGACVEFIRDDRPPIRIYLEDPIRMDAVSSINDFKHLQLKVMIMSGDHEASVANAASQLEIPTWYSSQTPEDKQSRMRHLSNALMVGDGANDTAAMAAASVSIAVKGSLELSVQVADCYLTRPGLTLIGDLIRLSMRVTKTVRWNLVISLLYNVLGIGLVLFGRVTPFVVAVLMPFSALSVYMNSFINVQKRRLT